MMFVHSAVRAINYKLTKAYGFDGTPWGCDPVRPIGKPASRRADSLDRGVKHYSRCIPGKTLCGNSVYACFINIDRHAACSFIPYLSLCIWLVRSCCDQWCPEETTAKIPRWSPHSEVGHTMIYDWYGWPNTLPNVFLTSLTVNNSFLKKVKYLARF